MDQPLPFEIPNVTVLLQPEEQVLEIPRHKVKNVKQLLKYLGIRCLLYTSDAADE